MPDHGLDKQLDIWGAKVYCDCGLTFAVRYPGTSAPNRETTHDRATAMAAAIEKWLQHKKEATHPLGRPPHVGS